MLSSTGGFWKKKNITIMLGVPADQLEQGPGDLEAVRGQAQADHLFQRSMPTGSQYAAAMPSVPVNVELGGVTVFVMDLEKLEKILSHNIFFDTSLS